MLSYDKQGISESNPSQLILIFSDENILPTNILTVFLRLQKKARKNDQNTIVCLAHILIHSLLLLKQIARILKNRDITHYENF